jgi:precorrin-2/cobalt-factor-2 C20-methyltransferase
MTEATGKIGRLYGVGIGPGDPELLTLRARRVLGEVPVIFVPKKDERSGSIAESIIAGLATETASKCVGIVLPMLRDHEKLRRHWQQASDIIWSHLSRGEDAAFVNVGDPFLYGTFIHVMRNLREKHPEVGIEVVPGVSSINAAAAGALVPLTTEHENIAVISGMRSEAKVRDALENFDTVVFMKVNRVFERLYVILEEKGLVDRSVYVRRCTTADEEIVTDISRLRGESLDYFSLLIVRK